MWKWDEMGMKKSHSRSTVLGICENENGNKFIGMRVEGLATLQVILTHL